MDEYIKLLNHVFINMHSKYLPGRGKTRAFHEHHCQEVQGDLRRLETLVVAIIEFLCLTKN